MRTASIALTEDQPPEAVFAALVHAAYDLARFDGFTQVPLRPGPRSPVQRELGPEVEALVREYHRTPWHDWTVAEDHVRNVDEYPEIIRRVLVLRIANELEDHLDLQRPPRHRLQGPHPRPGSTLVRLARALMPVLADELEEAFAEHVDVPVPAASHGPTHGCMRCRDATNRCAPGPSD